MPETSANRAGMSLAVDELSGYSGRFVALAERLPCAHPIPSRKTVAEITEDLRSVLFPGYFDGSEDSGENLHFRVGATLDIALRALEEQIRRALCFGCRETEAVAACSRRAAEITHQFLERLPEIQRVLSEDVMAAYEGDPACTSPDEVILAYPGLYALAFYRVAHELFELGVPLLPRMITEIAHGATGIDIHPGARIGRRFFIDHGTGVVIGATCIIGDRVRIYQGVTLGAKSFQIDDKGHPVKGVPRHPIIEDDVIIYAGATILGRITIGRESMIGGNVWLTQGVPAGSKVSQGSVRLEIW
jgi:serine O-acetyltransferase